MSECCRFTKFSNTKPRAVFFRFVLSHLPRVVKMLNSGSPQKTFLLAAVLVALVQCGHGQGKPTECCKKVSNTELTEEIFAYRVDGKPQFPCLPAVIFYTQNGSYCAAIRAPWVLRKAAAIRKAAAAQALTTSPPSKSSLLAIITSAASAPSSSAPSSSSSP